MKRFVLLLCLLVAVLASGCCAPMALGGGVVGSGHTVTREMDLTGFTRVQAGSIFVVDIKQGDRYDVAVTADDNLFDYVDASVSGETLRLRLRPGTSISRVTLRAEVTMPSLQAIELSGASRGTLTGFRSVEKLAIDLSGASSLRGDIEAGDVRLEISGASTVDLTGTGSNLSGNGSGASRMLLDDFRVQDADIALSGASSAQLYLSGRLSADLSGASSLEYAGSPTLGHTQTSGGSTIRSR